jgi:predicted alpha/beta-fold hydrolase
VTPTGGHCAFVERAELDYDGYWAEREIVRFATAHLAGPRAPSTPAKLMAL